MDGDLSKKLDAFLNSPDAMAKLGEAMSALGLSASDTPAPDKPDEPPAPADELSGLLKLAPLLSSIGKDDENTVLLKALRPYLHGDREKRLDESVKLMQLLKFLPILQERGLFH